MPSAQDCPPHRSTVCGDCPPHRSAVCVRLPSAQERCPRRTGSKGSAFALRHLVQRGCPRDSPASQSALIDVGSAHI